jgi:nucleotide-binding universal stress UspA family protein
MRVLVPVDSSEHSVECSKDASLALQRHISDLELVLLYVVDVGLIEAASLPGEYLDQSTRREHIRRKAEKSGEVCMSHLQKAYEKEGLRVETRVVVGYPSEEIVKTAQKEKVDLILMGSKKSGRRVPIGSVADKVVREALCPVLVLSPQAKVKDFKRVLLPYDGSRASRKSLEYAVQFCKRLDGEATILKIVDEYAVRYSAAISGSSSPDLAEALMEDYIRSAKDLLASAERTFQEEGVPLKTVVKVGSPAEEIIREAELGSYDLISIGTRGRGHFKKLVLGSVTAAVIGGSTVPVLVVR